MIFKPLASSSSGNAYLVSDGKTDLLIDCGIPWRQIREGCGFQTSKVAGCLISHSHQDHCRAAKDVARAGIDIYSSPETIQVLSGNGIPAHRIHVINQLPRRIGTWKVLAFPVRHDASCLGFLVASQAKKLLYLIDAAYAPHRFEGLTHIAIEANYSKAILERNVEAGRIHPDLAKRVIRNHMSLERCISFLKATDLSTVEAVWLLHLSDDNSDEVEFKRQVQAATARPVYVCQKRGGVGCVNTKI